MQIPEKETQFMLSVGYFSWPVLWGPIVDNTPLTEFTCTNDLLLFAQR